MALQRGRSLTARHPHILIVFLLVAINASVCTNALERGALVTQREAADRRRLSDFQQILLHAQKSTGARAHLDQDQDGLDGAAAARPRRGLRGESLAPPALAQPEGEAQVVTLDLGLGLGNGTVRIGRLEPQSYTATGGFHPGSGSGSGATANATGTWVPYFPAGARGFLWAQVNDSTSITSDSSNSSSSDSGSGAASGAWYPVCFWGNERAVQVANAVNTAFACVAAGYTLGYPLPSSYARSPPAPPYFSGGGGGAEGEEEQQPPQQQQLFINNMGCVISSGPDGTSTECVAELGPECVGAPAVLSCIPDAMDPLAVLDLDAVVDWQLPPPPPQGVAANGAPPLYEGDNVLYDKNYERYVWPAGSVPYETTYHVCVKKFAVVDPPTPLRLNLTVWNAGSLAVNQSLTWSYATYADGSSQGLFADMLSGWSDGDDDAQPAAQPSPPPPGLGTGGVCGPSSRGYLGSYAFTGRSSSDSSGDGGGGGGSGGGGSDSASSEAPPELEIVVGWSPAAPARPLVLDANTTVVLANGTVVTGDFEVIVPFVPLKFPPPPPAADSTPLASTSTPLLPPPASPPAPGHTVPSPSPSPSPAGEARHCNAVTVHAP